MFPSMTKIFFSCPPSSPTQSDDGDPCSVQHSQAIGGGVLGAFLSAGSPSGRLIGPLLYLTTYAETGRARGIRKN